MPFSIWDWNFCLDTLCMCALFFNKQNFEREGRRRRERRLNMYSSAGIFNATILLYKGSVWYTHSISSRLWASDLELNIFIGRKNIISLCQYLLLCATWKFLCRAHIWKAHGKGSSLMREETTFLLPRILEIINIYWIQIQLQIYWMWTEIIWKHSGKLKKKL